ncbi:MAG: 30S ribosomal protein S17 [Candidatus Doudnabacteria bacterium]|nr:30S ribosomal protein S17 [Candidatus Doudnabacteria bacterium]
MDKKQRTLVGKVIKKSSANTIKVRVEIKSTHPLYGKVVTRHKNYLVHCTNEQFDQVQLDQVVNIGETRPMSKLKSWALIESK